MNPKAPINQTSCSGLTSHAVCGDLESRRFTAVSSRTASSPKLIVNTGWSVALLPAEIAGEGRLGS
jgi:hypothetical protein